MGIVSANETWHGRNGSFDETSQRTYTRTFQVITDSRGTAENEVRFATGIPRLGDVYDVDNEFDIAARARNISVTQDADPKVWTVTVNYANLVGIAQHGATGGAARGRNIGVGPAASGSSYQPNPILRPARIEFDTEIYEKVAKQVVWAGEVLTITPLTNSAGDPFDPPVMIDDARPVITIHKNFVTWNMTNAMKYVNSINLTAFLGIAARKLKIARITAVDAEEAWEDPITQTQYTLTYVAATVVMHGNNEPWNPLKIVDRGFDQKVSGVRKRMLDPGTGMATSTPLPLDGTGLQLAIGSALVYREFNIYRETEFNDLGLF